MANSVFRSYDDLTMIFHKIDCLLEGAFQVAENEPNATIECGLIDLAQQKMKEARRLAQEILDAHKRTMAA